MWKGKIKEFIIFLKCSTFSPFDKRVDSQSQILCCSWAWPLFLGPAYPICLTVYITVDTLASFSQIACDSFSSDLAPSPWRAQMLSGYIKRCIRELTEKAMATHSGTLAWKIPWMEEPGGLQSMGSHRVGHNWSDLAAAVGSWKENASLGQGSA